MSIQLEHITKFYGPTRILDDVSLQVEEGELFVLLGASGSGKSTILRIIAGLTPADQGRVLLRGTDVTHLTPQVRDIGFVFQNYSIFRHMTVLENIEFGLKLRKLPAAERSRRSRSLLELVGLTGLGDRHPGRLSGGQQQRVALVRALVYEPKVLLLDEPFGALDVQIRAQLRRRLHTIQEALGVTTILVTHDQEEAFELADRIGVIERGRLLEVGCSENLYFHPRNPFVATFLGGGTVVVGQILEARARFGELSLPLPAEIEAEERARVQLVVRPEQVHLAPRGEAVPGAVFVGTGHVSEEYFTGSLRRLRIRLSHWKGTRQIAPAPPFGEEATLIDATIPASQQTPGSDVDVYFTSWHILKSPPLRQLVVSSRPGRFAPPPLLAWMTEGLDATATLLIVADDSIPSLEPAGSVSSRMETFIVPGEPVQTVMAEIDRVLYDLVALLPSGPIESDPLLDLLLQRSGLPVLVAIGPVDQVSRILICSGGGEPGKQDVRVGGRLARRLGVPVDLFHVVRPGMEPTPFTRRHLDNAATTLRALDLPVEVIVRESGDIPQAVLEEGQTRGAGLIVLGAHVPSRLFQNEVNVTREVIKRSDRPVLVIPSDQPAGKRLRPTP